MIDGNDRARLHQHTIDFVNLLLQLFPGIQPADLTAAVLSATFPPLVSEYGPEGAARHAHWLVDQVAASRLPARAPDDAPSLAIPGHDAALGPDRETGGPARGGAQGAELEGQGSRGVLRAGLPDDFVMDAQNRRTKTGCLDC